MNINSFGSDLITEVTRTLKRANGSGVKIVVRSNTPMDPQQSIGVDVFRRDGPDQDWISISGDEGIKDGLPEMLKAVSDSEVQSMINMIGQPLHETEPADCGISSPTP